MDNNLTYIKERFKQIADNQGIKYEELYKIISMTGGGFKGDNIKRPINSDAIEKIYTKFPCIDLHWLITGKKKSEEKNNKLNIDYKEKYIEKVEKIEQLQDKIIELEKELRSTFSKTSKLKKDDAIVYDK